MISYIYFNMEIYQISDDIDQTSSDTMQISSDIRIVGDTP